MSFNKITIVGLGLIGGSLAKALKKGKVAESLIGIDFDDKTIDYALSQKIIDKGFLKIEGAVESSDIVVISAYIGGFKGIIDALSTYVTRNTVITDVCSVKSYIVDEIGRLASPSINFVGGHPIAGTERSGIWVSDPALFVNRSCILTPVETTSPSALLKVKELWESVGAKVLTMDPGVHDKIFSFTSHLPHLIAYSLINTVNSLYSVNNVFDYAGGGLKDYTRIAESSPQMWCDIFLSNKEHLLEAVDRFSNVLGVLREAVEKSDSSFLINELRKASMVKSEMND